MSHILSTEDIEEQLRIEFIDDSRDRLTRLNALLERTAQNAVPVSTGIASIRMEAHSFKGIGTTFGFPGVSLIAHRLEDYMAGLASLTTRQLEDVQVFVDRIAELVDRAEQPELAETNQIIRSLPVRYVFNVDDVEVRNVEIMLVTPSRVVSKLVGTEMSACGYRVVTVHDPIESLSLAVRMPPDMLIASLVMDHLSGLDLIKGLRAMSLTAKVPMALLTSMDMTNPVLREIPKGAVVIRVGNHFGEDFANAITHFNLG